MILIADSGASKTEWACISRQGGERISFISQGYNPNYISGESIVEDIRLNMPESLPEKEVTEIHFYGAGVTPLQYPFMTETLLVSMTVMTSVTTWIPAASSSETKAAAPISGNA